MRTGAVTGVEALLRWDHPERGLLGPDEFIPLAQEIGMMATLTEWVLRTALRQLKRWRNLGIETRISVNLSSQDFRDTRLPNTVMRLLALHDVAPSQICLEIGEATITGEPEHAAEALARFSAIGVRLSVDDFGTGYSTPRLLKRFPVDELKIDRSFVTGMSEDSHDAAIVAASIEMAHKLGLDVLATGVEDQATWDAIAKLGADLVQGNFVTAPLPSGEIDVWLQSAPARFAVALSEATTA